MKTAYKTLALLIIIIGLYAIPACELLKNTTGVSKDLKNLTRKLDSATSNSITLRSILDTLAKSAGQNAAIGMSHKADSISIQFINGLKGITDTLNPDIKKLMSLIGQLTDSQLVLIGHRITEQMSVIKGNIKDDSLKNFLFSIVEGVTGRLNNDTKNLLSNMIKNALDTLESEASKKRLNSVIDSLLNESSKQRIGAFLSGILQPSIDSIMLKTDKITQKDIPFIQKQATKLLISLGALAFAIIGYIGYQQRKYLKLIRVLTTQIEFIPQQKVYDELTHNIRKQTVSEGVEPLLRKILSDQGNNDTL